MAGIVSYGAYIPFHRLQRAAIGAALETKADKGERAIASYNEDTVTMAVEAARAAVAGATRRPSALSSPP
jgi:3-hydroxy-3-methylglutaryl CoA synthase